MIGLALNFSEIALITEYAFRDGQEKILIDVGANVGGVTSHFASRGWRVIAFEPVPSMVEEFKVRNAKFGDRVTLIQHAVSDVSGQTVPFFTSDIHPGIHTLKPFHETHQASMEVTTIRLDEALRSQNVSHVTLLKVDIEGADFLALKGFDFEQWQPEMVMIEFMDDRSASNFDYTHHDVAAFMNEMGYSTFVSEWEAITTYYEPGKPTAHRFIQLAPYPLEHTPAWGNLIFVPHGDEHKLTTAYNQLKTRQIARTIKDFIKRIPGAVPLYRLLRGIN